MKYSRQPDLNGEMLDVGVLYESRSIKEFEDAHQLLIEILKAGKVLKAALIW